MKPIDQTKLYFPNGNCLAASLASILELQLSEVPEFEKWKEDTEEWWWELNKWLEEIGFTLLQWSDGNPSWLPGYYLVSGISERGISHIVVYQNGKMVHDPHPSKTGLKEIKESWALLLIDPSKCNHRIHSGTACR